MERGGDALDDGYHWHVIMDKQLEDRCCTRTYYTCSHPGCQVAKAVERSWNRGQSPVTVTKVHDWLLMTKRACCTAYHAHPDCEIQQLGVAAVHPQPRKA